MRYIKQNITTNRKPLQFVSILNSKTHLKMFNLLLFPCTCTAGGLAVYLHVDQIGSMFPEKVNFRGIVDGGFFLDEKNISNYLHYRAHMRQIFAMQLVEGNNAINANNAFTSFVLFVCFCFVFNNNTCNSQFLYKALPTLLRRRVGVTCTQQEPLRSPEACELQ